MRREKPEREESEFPSKSTFESIEKNHLFMILSGKNMRIQFAMFSDRTKFTPELS